MSIEALNWALDHIKATDEMSTASKFVLMLIANRTSDETGMCYPSVRYLMKRTSLSDSGVRAACKDLQSRGLLEIHPRRRDDGAKTSNNYRLRLDTPPPQVIEGAPPVTTGAHPQSQKGAPPVSGGQDTKERDLLTLTGGTAGSAKAPPPHLNGKIVAQIPILGNKEWGVTETYLHELETAYPAVDGKQTLQEIRAWCISNPTQRKTERGVMRFINSWFSREQNAPVRR